MAARSRCLGFPDLPLSSLWDPGETSLLHAGNGAFWDGGGLGKKQHAERQQAYHRRRTSLRNDSRFAFGSKWAISGSGGEGPVTASEVLQAFAGVVIVGDSTLREVGWAVLQLLGGGRRRVHSRRDRVTLRCASSLFVREDVAHYSIDRHPISDISRRCIPRAFGRYGFTATCAAGSNGHCVVQSPLADGLENETALCTRVPDGRVAQIPWDGKLVVSPAVCSEEWEFFVAYHATWTMGQVALETLPDCLRPKEAGDKSGLRRGGRFRPVLFILNGSPIHEAQLCSERRPPASPRNALSHLSPEQLSAVVWFPMASVSHAFLTRPTTCSSERGRELAAMEKAWLQAHRVRFWDNDALMLQFAPLSVDLIHFTCASPRARTTAVHCVRDPASLH